MRFLEVVIILLLLVGCNHPESREFDRDRSVSRNDKKSNDNETTALVTNEEAYERKYKVLRIKDGDTFIVLVDGKEQTVRFANIDCPEKTQPFGGKAKEFVSERCLGKFVALIHDNKFDRNQRLIAEIILQDGQNLNKLLVKNGLAWHFTKYSDDEQYALLEKEARMNRVGIWSDKEQIAPWEFRAKKRDISHAMTLVSP